MNLFILDPDPIRSAIFNQDLHVKKIIIEGAQMLANAYDRIKLAEPGVPRTDKGTPRVGGLPNHPMSKWVRENMSNFKWTLLHVQTLCKEYTHRFGQRHYTEGFIDWVAANLPVLNDNSLTLQPQCFAQSYPECIVPGDPVKGYHNYYNKAKQFFLYGKNSKTPRRVFASWTNREVPYFFTPMSRDI
jgi:hypothetical protein